ncbi:hypothetical protein H310_04179 [Aphanomyces invadans]|uniref:Phosducin domain-containing protein n=1 Tax=Aphanomyces invadans TaxID=157072 RepID=A0A024UFX5_9STRA|nr:hypothetical protein H310_04179 [Aphanomyces invadans]ETW05184.1 hypothetical protein H310_04179 [Aphanomyces invadans]|eukprot:XP_008866622.1 hypothetical protein H310_04179 [Aphanomyces invadans]
MDDFFLRHDVYKDRDADELGGKVDSDSEASDNEESLPASVHDPYGPWQEQQDVSKQGKRRQFKKSTFTGPKGVLNDYKAYKQAKAEERAQEVAVREMVLARIAKGYVRPSDSAPPAPEHSNGCCNALQNNVHDSDDDLLDEFEDDALLQKYCAKRVAEIQSAVHAGAPTFGTVKYCSAFDFVDLVDAADPRTPVVVHMSDESNGFCVAVNNCLQQLSPEHPRTQFLVVEREEVDPSIRPEDLPIFMVYHGGSQVDTILNVASKLQHRVTVERVALLLHEHI